MKPMFKKIFVLDGNIGAGKSTLLHILEQSFQNVFVLYEPVEKWKNVAGDNLLNEFYSIPSRWGFTFELYSMFTKIKALREALKSEKDIIIMERSIYSDWVFQDISYALDKIDLKELAILEEFRYYFLQDMPKIDGFIYLETIPTECLKRIKKRNRPEERKIDLDYLVRLEKELKIMLMKHKNCLLNGDYDLKKPQNIVKTVENFINMSHV